MAQRIDPGTQEPATWLDGTDPAGWADTAAATDPFPPPLDLDVRTPDGGWVDPGLLGRTADDGGGDDGGDGDGGDDGDDGSDPPDALRADLAAADGDPDADWATLRESEDPAVRALARYWRP